MKDFDFLNRDTVITGVSKRSFGMTIFDLLMPTSRNIIYSSKELGGTKVCTLLRSQQILAFNSMKNWQVSIFDIRKNQVIQTIQLGLDEITAVTLSKNQQTLITGSKEGVVKVWDIHNSFNLRESIDAFVDQETRKKHEVS